MEALEKAIEQAAEHVKKCQIGFHRDSISRTTIQDIITRHIGPVVKEMKVQMGSMLRTIDQYERKD